jgi:hypothetical protein
MCNWWSKKKSEIDSIEEGFASVSTVTIDVDGRAVRVIRLSQMPVMRVLPIVSEQEPARQMQMLVDLLKSALVDPLDWDNHLQLVSLESLHHCINEWTKSFELEGKRHGKKKRR